MARTETPLPPWIERMDALIRELHTQQEAAEEMIKVGAHQLAQIELLWELHRRRALSNGGDPDD